MYRLESSESFKPNQFRLRRSWDCVRNFLGTISGHSRVPAGADTVFRNDPARSATKSASRLEYFFPAGRVRRSLYSHTFSTFEATIFVATNFCGNARHSRGARHLYSKRLMIWLANWLTIYCVLVSTSFTLHESFEHRTVNGHNIFNIFLTCRWPQIDLGPYTAG